MKKRNLLMNEWKKKPPLKAWHFAFLCEGNFIFIGERSGSFKRDAYQWKKYFELVIPLNDLIIQPFTILYSSKWFNLLSNCLLKVENYLSYVLEKKRNKQTNKQTKKRNRRGTITKITYNIIQWIKTDEKKRMQMLPTYQQ